MSGGSVGMDVEEPRRRVRVGATRARGARCASVASAAKLAKVAELAARRILSNRDFCYHCVWIRAKRARCGALAC